MNFVQFLAITFRLYLPELVIFIFDLIYQNNIHCVSSILTLTASEPAVWLRLPVFVKKAVNDKTAFIVCVVNLL
ncbi:MAG: hypothetical protein COA86_18885 [Kangiella sp.]|nr:MAG: hypothetical protein COA86_18885 [Kangiella sp.]